MEEPKEWLKSELRARWNTEVSEAVKKKRKLYRVAFKFKTEEDKLAYNAAKQDAKKQLLKLKRQSVGNLVTCLTEKMDGRISTR